MPGTTVSTIDPTTGGADDSARVSRRVILVHGTQVGRYVILSVLGKGGMGVVYAAHDPQLDRQVALKLIRTADSAEEAERLVREAQALAKLADPHVVAVYDAGEVDGQVFVAMQLVDGEDLAVALRSRKATVAQVLAWFVDAGRGLAAAHTAGIVHRDFKPSNVLIDKKGRVAVTDFGIARELGATRDPDRRQLSGADRLIGTPAYMAPEQHGLERATERSDQFAFCVSVWEALFGQHPFAGERTEISVVELGIAIFEGKLVRPKNRRGVPRHVVDALARGLAHEPAERWPAMTDLLAQLAPVKQRRARRWPLVACGVAIAAAGGAYALWPSSRVKACEASAARVDAAWTPDQRRQVKAMGSMRYAPHVGAMLVDGIDAYASRWRAATLDACLAPAPLAEACLDERLDELRGFASVIAGSPEHAADATPELIRALAPLADCMKAAALPPPGAARLRFELGEALAHSVWLDDRARAKRELADLASRGAQLGWTPLVARATYLVGIVERELGDDGKTSLTSAAEMSTASGLDLDAAQAWIAVLDVAAPEEVDTVAAMARAQVARVAGEPSSDALALAAEIAYGRALVRARRFDEAEQRCASARTRAGTSDPLAHVTARLCEVGALAGEDRLPQAAVLRADFAVVEEVYGPGHPATADLLAFHVKALASGSPGAIAAVREELETIRGMRARVYPPSHPLVALADRELGALAILQGRPDQARDLYRRALDAVSERRDQSRLAADLYARLSRLEPDAQVALSDARTAVHLDTTPSLYVDLVVAASRAGSWAEAARISDEVLAADGVPEARPTLEWVLARALVMTHGDADRARKLAMSARDAMAKAGDAESTVAAIDSWLLAHH